MKYVVLIVGDESRWAALSPEENKKWRLRIDEWADRMRAEGKYFGEGAELVPSTEARTIRGSTVTDGPYIETKEVVGGWEEVHAESLDEAVEYAKAWPGVADGLVTAEVRRIIQH